MLVINGRHKTLECQHVTANASLIILSEMQRVWVLQVIDFIKFGHISIQLTWLIRGNGKLHFKKQRKH